MNPSNSPADMLATFQLKNRKNPWTRVTKRRGSTGLQPPPDLEVTRRLTEFNSLQHAEALPNTDSDDASL